MGIGELYKAEGDNMRVFLAVNLQAELQAELAQIQDRLRKKIKGVRWVAPPLLHITLKFLGEQDEAALCILEKSLQELGEKTAAFTLSLAGLGAFPSLNNPRVLWIGTEEGTRQLCNLAEEIEQRSKILNFQQHSEQYSKGKPLRVSRQQFRPHITLGRKKKKGEILGAANNIFTEPRVCKNKLWVDRFCLMQSKLYPTGPVYTTVREFLFKKN
ncbi:MAG: RNA 2',3'-cyclic phosphodiesterase [Firmicutes bacterium]|nr:RNA 2',3'-cyclic phosphodiesterase [Bacillota bacterium]